jgi:hypothetical protein
MSGGSSQADHRLDIQAELADIIEQFPELAVGLVSITSCSCSRYNCTAWAAGLTTTLIAPAFQRHGRLIGGYFWPSSVAARYTVRAYEEVYETFGYRSCDDGEFVIGIEKIALYGHDSGECLHAARQTINGMWTSKMGACADIEHYTPHVVEGKKYGRVLAFMAREYGRPLRLEPGPAPSLILPPRSSSRE